MKGRCLKPGFTLIELAAASAVAAVLMGGVLAVFTSIARDRVRLSAARPAERRDQAPIIELLRRELSCCNKFEMVGPNALDLQTCGSLDDNAVVDRPSHVTYRIVRDQQMSWLVREQEFSDEPVAPRSKKDLVAFHVRHLDVEVLHDFAPQTGELYNLRPRDPKDIPRRVRIKLEFDDHIADIYQEVCLR
jgi:prepilin-type N-terminal cleavage/methylation domain-containing protein